MQSGFLRRISGVFLPAYPEGKTKQISIFNNRREDEKEKSQSYK